MITREQLEKQLGLDKYTKQQIDEQLAILKAEREHFSKEIDNIRQLLEKKQDTELSVKQETENLRKELGKLDKLPKLLDDNISELKNTTEILVSYYNVLNVLIESENDKNNSKNNDKIKCVVIYHYDSFIFYVRSESEINFLKFLKNTCLFGRCFCYLLAELFCIIKFRHCINSLCLKIDNIL